MHHEFADGLIVLRPLRREDAAAHLAGEDDDIMTWLSAGRSTAATVAHYIDRCAQDWRTHGATRAFGVFDVGTGVLVGSVEANLGAAYLEAGQANVSYGVFAAWRGRGIALRALRLMCRYLELSTDARQVVLRCSPQNRASIRVAEKAGFQLSDAREADGALNRYVLNLSGHRAVDEPHAQDSLPP